MTNSTVTPLVQPGAFSDLLTEVLRSGAQRLLAHAVEAEVSVFIDAHAGERLDDGRARIVRHGHLPERDIQTVIGAVRVQQPRVRDRVEDGSARIDFSPGILPKHARRTKSLDAVLPILYLKGISSGSFQDALSALLGPEAPNLSSDTILRLRKSWEEDLAHWRARDLSARRYVYNLGRRDLFPGPHGGSKPMHAGHYNGPAGGYGILRPSRPGHDDIYRHRRHLD